MFEVCRRIRCCLPLGNSNYAGEHHGHDATCVFPCTLYPGLYYEFTITCSDELSEDSAMVLPMQDIDHAMRQYGLACITESIKAGNVHPIPRLLTDMICVLQEHVAAQVIRISWHQTPLHTITLEQETSPMYVISQVFQFSSAHCLRTPGADNKQNREQFGKCSNVHGHNYRLSVDIQINGTDEVVTPSFPDLESVVMETVIKRFDHADLNELTDVFTDGHTSVENIAKACHDLLIEPIAAIGGALKQVTVWETEKSSCTFSTT